MGTGMRGLTMKVVVVVVATLLSSSSAIVDDITGASGPAAPTQPEIARPAASTLPEITSSALPTGSSNNGPPRVSTSRPSALPNGSPSNAPRRIPSSSTVPPPSHRPNCLPRVADGKADAEGMTKFGMNVFRQLAKEGNVFFSPFNLWSALALAYLGAEGQTSRQMGRVLGLKGQKNALDYLNGLENELSSRFDGHQNLSLEAASKVYINKGFPINSCLHSTLTSRLQTIDFTQLTEAANIINRYVNQTTRGLIKKIVSASQLAATQMAIVSAIYFYGSWETAFNPLLTTNAAFYPDPSARSTEVKMMSMETSLMLGQSSELGARVLRLPYTTGTVSMYLLLPDEEGPRGFDATLRALNPASLQGAISGLEETLVQVGLPKFKMEGEYKDNLEEALKNLGATDMFSRGLADFSSFSPSVYVSTVAHKAYVDVSEAGTEAAAVTAVLIDVRSSARAEAQVFRCNRPFIFVIYDDVTKVVLFVGAYKTPP